MLASRFPLSAFLGLLIPLAVVLTTLGVALRHVAASDGPDPVAPPVAFAPPGASALHTDGAQLVDADGQVVLINGVNWFGLETSAFAPHGLWARNYDDMLAQIAASGFNTVRLPFSDQLLEPSSVPQGIDYQRNPDLQGMSGLAVMDAIIAAAGRHGLAVILDRHRPTAAAQSELWYTPQVPESRWIQDWQMLAARYRGNPTVIGADLHNEPHGPATWGDGNLATDWRLAAERAGNAVLAVNPDWLIFVEGIEHRGDDWYWWGGNLAPARDAPVRLSAPDKLVYAPHDYGPGVYRQPWFTAPDFPNNLPPIWQAHWAYLQQEGIAPVFVGEFGGRSVGSDAEGIWQQSLLSYLRANGISYTYWSWNPDSGDTGGILEDDWNTLDQRKLAMLSSDPTVATSVAAGQPVATAGQPVAAPTDPSPAPSSGTASEPVTPPALAAPPAAPTVAAPPCMANPSQFAASAPPGALHAAGGPFDPDPQHALAGFGGPSDGDAAHRQARAQDELLYFQTFGSPWPCAAYTTGTGATP